MSLNYRDLAVIREAIERCAQALGHPTNREWVVGYSGGKDSTATLKIFLAALKLIEATDASISVIYCDTGVENPALDSFVKRTLRSLAKEIPLEFPKAKVRILKAPVEERFFVRVVGRGYAPPSNRFRWCTKGLRIRPVERYLSAQQDEVAVVLGMRYGESLQRDRSLKVGETSNLLWQKQREGTRRDMLLPIVDFALEDVWMAVQALEYPHSIDVSDLEELYRGASGECPMIRSPSSPPCASGRFGCWTCTVVRRDRSTQNLIDRGYQWLGPYLEFRNWLQEFRAAEGMRWPVRRNGDRGPGPFTIRARKLILRKLQLLEMAVDRELLRDEEILRIRELWGKDVETEAFLCVN